MSKKSRPKGLVAKIDLSGLPDSERLIPTGESVIPQANNDDINIPKDLKLGLQLTNLEVIQELGAGNGGTVFKVRHKEGVIMALKVYLNISIQTIHVDANTSVQKQILRELQILHDCNSPYIVGYYGAFLDGRDISVCMEYMHCGSLDGILKHCGSLPLEIVGKISYSVLSGLVYLFDCHRIIHRGLFRMIINGLDVKPSNILINALGEIKLADFGVSGELLTTLANTFVGTSAYMSPERIQGLMYSVQCDIWSLGLTVVELVTGNFPFPSGDRQFSVFELLEFIVKEKIPVPPAGQFPREFDEFVARWYVPSALMSSLIKNHDGRPTPLQLLSDPFIIASRSLDVDLARWAQSLIS